MDESRDAVTDQKLWELIEDYILAEVVRDRLGEDPEPWDEMNQDN